MTNPVSASTETVPYVVLELNAESVRTAKAHGLPLYYGDATSEEALKHAHLERAQALVLLMNDPIAAQRVVDTAKRVAPDVPIMMRTKYLLEREALIRIGAKDVVAEEVEGAIEILARLLRWIEVPRNPQPKPPRRQTLTTMNGCAVWRGVRQWGSTGLMQRAFANT